VTGQPVILGATQNIPNGIYNVTCYDSVRSQITYTGTFNTGDGYLVLEPSLDVVGTWQAPSFRLWPNLTISGSVVFAGGYKGLTIADDMCGEGITDPLYSRFIGDTYDPSMIYASNTNCPMPFSGCNNISLCYAPSINVQCVITGTETSVTAGAVPFELMPPCYYASPDNQCLVGWAFSIPVAFALSMGPSIWL
jgi:hypothetical protein